MPHAAVELSLKTTYAAFFDGLQVLSINCVRLGDLVMLPGEVYRLTLGCVEVHEPVLLPDLELVHVLL